jgi:hypothetical protein
MATDENSQARRPRERNVHQPLSGSADRRITRQVVTAGTGCRAPSGKWMRQGSGSPSRRAPSCAPMRARPGPTPSTAARSARACRRRARPPARSGPAPRRRASRRRSPTARPRSSGARVSCPRSARRPSRGSRPRGTRRHRARAACRRSRRRRGHLDGERERRVGIGLLRQRHDDVAQRAMVERVLVDMAERDAGKHEAAVGRHDLEARQLKRRDAGSPTSTGRRSTRSSC